MITDSLIILIYYWDHTNLVHTHTYQTQTCSIFSSLGLAEVHEVIPSLLLICKYGIVQSYSWMYLELNWDANRTVVLYHILIGRHDQIHLLFQSFLWQRNRLGSRREWNSISQSDHYYMRAQTLARSAHYAFSNKVGFNLTV